MKVVPPLRVSSLGRFAVQGLRGGALGGSEHRTQVRTLLALAAASRQGVSREELIELLWPRLADSAARNRLYHTLHLLRRALDALAWPDEWVLLQRGRVMLDPRVDSDAIALDEAASGPLDTLSDAALMSVLDACQGEWAPEVDAGGLGHTIRRHLQDCHARVLHEAALRLEQGGDTPARRTMLRRVLQLSSTDEWAYRQLMQLDLDAQRPHAVLRSFEQASRALVQQLGLRPSQALSELAAHAAALLEAGATEAAAPEPRQATLVGREALVRELATALNQQPGLWNLSGLSGVGKTVLMHEVARRVGPRRAAGVRHVALGDRADGETSIAAVVRAAQFNLNTTEAPAQVLCQQLATRDLLLVIDDLDLSPQWQALVALLVEHRHTLSARVVLITHTPLDAAGVRPLPLPPLAGALPDTPLAQARLSPAVSLFEMRRGALDARALSEPAVREVVELVRRLDGLPLAIELAAARTATMTPGEILRQLDQGLLPFAAGRPAQVPLPAGVSLPERHRSVATALDITVQQLGPAARLAYLGAAVFQGHFSAAQLEAVLDAAGLSAALPAADALAELLGAGLLARAEAGEGLRMLHLPRSHARALAAAEGAWPGLESARIDQVVAALEAGQTHHESPGYTAWMAQVLRLHDDALGVLNAAQRIDDARFLRLLVPLTQSWSLRGQRQVPLGWFEQGLAVAVRLADVPGQLLILLAMSNTLLGLKRVDEALRHTEHAMQLAEACEQRVAVAMMVTMRAHALAHGGHGRESLQLLQAWLLRLPAGTPGHLTLSSALIFKGAVVPGVSPQDAQWSDSGGLRAQTAGSLAWRNLLVAVDDCVTTLSPQTHLQIATELLAVAREMHTPWLGHHALNRQAIAHLWLDRREDALAAAREWHRLAAASGLDASTGMACLLLAELAWREDDTAAAALWLDEVPPLVPGASIEDRVLCALTVTRAIVALMAERTQDAIAFYLVLPRRALAAMRWPDLELAVECAALLARALGEGPLQAQLGAQLQLLAEPNERVPARQRFRHRHLGLALEPVPAQPAEAVERAGVQAREGLLALHDRLQLQAAA